MQKAQILKESGMEVSRDSMSLENPFVLRG